MRALLIIVTLALSLPAALAQTGDAEAQPWQQCGGITWKGFTTCTKGYVCHEYNEYYSQCIPAPVLTSTSTTSFPADTITPTPTTTTAGPVTTTTGTGCGPWRAMMPRSTGPAIRASDGWAAGLYLQKSATLGPASSRGWFLPSNSIRLIAGDCPRYLFLNIHEAATSYKPLAFEVAMTTDTWRIAPGTGIIGTTTGADTFVACSDGALYLQTGSQLPTGNCTTTHLATAYN